MRSLMSKMNENDLSYSQVVDQMIVAKSDTYGSQRSKVFIKECVSEPPSPLRDENQ